MNWLKRDGRSLGDPGKNPWCGDFVETCIRMGLPDEPLLGALGTNPYWARNWLLFGERTAAHDSLFDAELTAWMAQGTLTRLDRAFSRDGHSPRYVQDALSAAGDAVAQWVAQDLGVQHRFIEIDNPA